MPKETRPYWKMRLDNDGREYRCYKNILWGKRYNPDTKAHHCRAMNAKAAADILKPDGASGFTSMQVYSGGRWQWVTETPERLGGIAKHWHGERN